jgi:hypothetical protein
MTRIAIGSGGATYLVMARLDRAIQMACECACFLDDPVKPGHDKEAREV